MSERVNISDSEWYIMNELWKTPGQELKDISKALKDKTSWNSGRIRTMLLRLIDKGVVTADQTTGVYKYYASVEKNSCVKEESKSFLKKIYSGSISKFIAAFAKDGEISEEEQKEILQIISSMNNGEKNE